LAEARDCDFTFAVPDFHLETVIANISDKHFTLHYVEEDDGDNFAYVVDHSTHGTFLNGELIDIALNGRRQLMIQQDDIISVVTETGPGMK
jgi:FHA domain